jgi:hypothetical protein
VSHANRLHGTHWEPPLTVGSTLVGVHVPDSHKSHNCDCRVRHVSDELILREGRWVCLAACFLSFQGIMSHSYPTIDSSVHLTRTVATWTRAGKFYCVPCFHDKFSPKCAECAKVIKGPVRVPINPMIPILTQLSVDTAPFLSPA